MEERIKKLMESVKDAIDDIRIVDYADCIYYAKRSQFAELDQYSKSKLTTRAVLHGNMAFVFVKSDSKTKARGSHNLYIFKSDSKYAVVVENIRIERYTLPILIFSICTAYIDVPYIHLNKCNNKTMNVTGWSDERMNNYIAESSLKISDDFFKALEGMEE